MFEMIQVEYRFPLSLVFYRLLFIASFFTAFFCHLFKRPNHPGCSKNPSTTDASHALLSICTLFWQKLKNSSFDPIAFQKRSIFMIAFQKAFHFYDCVSKSVPFLP